MKPKYLFLKLAKENTIGWTYGRADGLTDMIIHSLIGCDELMS
jgi:hypothetical protein